jgi:hypothetical protein
MVPRASAAKSPFSDIPDFQKSLSLLRCNKRPPILHTQEVQRKFAAQSIVMADKNKARGSLDASGQRGNSDWKTIQSNWRNCASRRAACLCRRRVTACVNRLAEMAGKEHGGVSPVPRGFPPVTPTFTRRMT